MSSLASSTYTLPSGTARSRSSDRSVTSSAGGDYPTSISFSSSGPEWRNNNSTEDYSTTSERKRRPRRRLRLKHVFNDTVLAKEESQKGSAISSTDHSAIFQSTGRELRASRSAVFDLQSKRKELLKSLANSIGETYQRTKRTFVKEIRRNGPRREDRKIRNVNLLKEWVEVDTGVSRWNDEMWTRQNDRLRDELGKSKLAESVLKDDIAELEQLSAMRKSGSSQAESATSTTSTWTPTSNGSSDSSKGLSISWDSVRTNGSGGNNQPMWDGDSSSRPRPRAGRQRALLQAQAATSLCPVAAY
ncbi:hypothetical protein IAR55_006694 [Kwoniella newhampshirensis]|uniref:Uncharacterized protein n=1 Tax=Kwoniella newhampshirensis TaxID=1651941 RepID=A0AAW0YUH8_9TREE